MVKRYIFHIHMLTGEGVENYNITGTDTGNNASVHTEYYFTEFVPVPYEIDPADVTASMLWYDHNHYSILALDIT